MSFSLSISLFFVVTVFYIVIIDVFTMLFRITGLTEEKAKFQVISLLTNSGYSTKESELVVDVLPRRRFARTIMLFGYVFAITVVSVFVNMMQALPASEQREIWPALTIVSVLFVIFMFVRRIPVVRMAFNSVLERMGRKLLYRNQDNPIMLQEEYPRGNIATVTLNTLPPLFNNTSIGDLKLRDKYGVHIFYLRRDGAVILNIKGSTVLQQHDQVVVFGTKDNIRNVFESTSNAAQPVKQAAQPETAAEFIRQEDAGEHDAPSERPVPPPPKETVKQTAPKEEPKSKGAKIEHKLADAVADVKGVFEKGENAIERRMQKNKVTSAPHVPSKRVQKFEEGEEKLAKAIVHGVEKGKEALQRGTQAAEEDLAQHLNEKIEARRVESAEARAKSEDQGPHENGDGQK